MGSYSAERRDGAANAIISLHDALRKHGVVRLSCIPEPATHQTGRNPGPDIGPDLLHKRAPITPPQVQGEQ